MKQAYKSMIETEWRDDDGYWIALKAGFCDAYNPQCHTIHENTKHDAHYIAQDAVPCICRECKMVNKKKSSKMTASVRQGWPNLERVNRDSGARHWL